MSEMQEPEAEVPPLRSGPILLDGRPTRSPAVIVLSDESTAVWLVDLAGEPCGAWVWPALDSATARRVLSLVDRRALIAIDAANTLESVRAITAAGKLQLADETLSSRMCSIPELLAETGQARSDIEEAVKQEARAGKKKLAPMQWDRPVPTEPTSDLTALMTQSGIATVEDPRVAGPLDVARLTRWAIRLWTDTEGKRARRSYLRQRFGLAQPLPAVWTKAITGAYDTPFEL